MEDHHILPKSLFPQFKDFKLSPWNRIRLTPRQHFIAHRILCEVFTDTCHAASCMKAFNMMSVNSGCHDGNREFTSRQFEAARKSNSESMKLKNPMHNQEIKSRAIQSMKASFTKERRENLSAARIGVNNISDEGRAKLSELWKGKPRPRKEGQQDKIRESMSEGLWKTPFGDFLNPTQAANSTLNKDRVSRYTIKKLCIMCENGYEFIPRIDS